MPATTCAALSSGFVACAASCAARIAANLAATAGGTGAGPVAPGNGAAFAPCRIRLTIRLSRRAGGNAAIALIFRKQHFLIFLPDPQGHVELRPRQAVPRAAAFSLWDSIDRFLALLL